MKSFYVGFQRPRRSKTANKETEGENKEVKWELAERRMGVIVRARKRGNKID